VLLSPNRGNDGLFYLDKSRDIYSFGEKNLLTGKNADKFTSYEKHLASGGEME
jgi:hypothetical protein